VHVFRQAVAPQAYGAQSLTTFAGQAVAAPLQADANVSAPPLHDAGAPHDAPTFPAGWTQPTAVSQASAVHGLVSVQSMAAPLLQAPALQASPEVQALPSLHGAPVVAFGFEHTPVVVLHAPVVWH
jgi:hypothetical protein